MDFASRRLAPKREALAALVDRIAPGGRVVRTRRLPGGLGCRMDVVAIERADGSRWKVTLRRFVRPEHRFSTTEHVAHEFEVLRLIERAEIPAPRPIFLDASGECFGVPAIVMSYLPGRPVFPATGIERWTEDLARGLLTVHAVTPERFDLSWLSVFLRDGMGEKNEQLREAHLSDRFAVEIHTVLEDDLDRINFSRLTLVHNDYWPGNTVSYRGRLVGIVDWSGAEIGDPRADVAQCRIDLVLSHGIEVADAFRDHYERLADRPVPDLWYFDLYRGVRAFLEYELWLEGYHDMGLRHLKQLEVGARLRSFLRRALDEAAQVPRDQPTR